MKRLLLTLALLLFLPMGARAHVGSKDVFQTVDAGPYTLYVTIRPPNVIPGVATVEIRSNGSPVSSLRIAPLPVTGEAAKIAPTADAMQRSQTDPNFFTGGVWIMASGTWQVRITADGASGEKVASVPVLAVPIATLRMQRGMGLALAAGGLFLIVTMAGLIAAAVREARLPPGADASPAQRRSGLIAMGIALAVMLAVVLLGDKWWNVEAAGYAGNIYAAKPLTTSLSGNVLDLTVAPVQLSDGRVLPPRTNVDYLLDHGKIMHLYAIREPQMDAVFHLHPTLPKAGDFRVTLPSMPPGHYQLYGDIVHSLGFPETLQGTVDIPANLPASPLDGEDASAAPAPLAAGLLGPAYKLPDGYTMQWERPQTITANTAYAFRFHLLDPAGNPAADMQPYLGMAGHAAFVKTDGTTFAHTHPEGSASMQDVALADQTIGTRPMAMDGSVTSDVSFPYGFPSAGRYRIFIQMKHGNTVETGVFDAEVK